MAEPILVESLTAEQALVICCWTCGTQRTITVDEIYNEDLYDCPKACGGTAGMLYWETAKCPNCGKLDFGADAVDGACSRRCALQVEYAKELELRG